MRPFILAAVAALSLLPTLACDLPAPPGIRGSNPLQDDVGAPPGHFYDVYTQYLNGSGVAVVGTAAVEPASLELADAIVQEFFAGQDAMVEELVSRGAYVALYALSESRSVLPEMNETGAGAATGSEHRDAMLYIAEDHVLCVGQYAEVVYSEDTLVHELGHLVQHHGVYGLDRVASEAPRDLYNDAIGAGLWADTYAATNPTEYLAEGVQSYFDLNAREGWLHNDVDSAEALAEYDPGLYAYVSEWFSGNALPSSCETRMRALQEASWAVGADERDPAWTRADGSYDTSSPWPVVVGGELADDDPISQWCERFPECSRFEEPEYEACRAVAASDRGIARSLDVPDYTLELAECAERSSCFDFLDCRFERMYGAFPWTDDP